jgi:hypothetical protein
MPQRTNEFQDLVALIEQALAPQGAKVTKSALVPGLSEEQAREIDVLIESMLGPYRMKVAVEAKDENRPMDITRFESIIAKYIPTSGIRVDKVVVIASAGFTEQVKDRAKLEKIEVLTLSEAMVSDWADHRRGLTFMIGPVIAGFEFDPLPPQTDPKILVNSANFVCTCCGRNHGTPMDFARQTIMDPDLIHDVRVAASRSPNPICAKLEWNLAKPIVLAHGSERYRIDRMRCHLHCSCGRGKFDVKAYKRGDQTIHHFTTTTGGHTIQLVVPNEHASEKSVLKIDGAPPKPGAAAVVGEPAPTAPRLPISKDRQQLLKYVESQLAGVDARLDVQTTVHNFSTGQEEYVDCLIRIYLAGTQFLRTAVLFVDGSDYQERIRDLDYLARGAQLDRLLVICDTEIATKARQLSCGSPVYLLPTPLCPADLLKAICPPVVLWSESLTAFHAALYSADGRKPEGLPSQAMFILGEKVMPIQQFYDVLNGRILLASIDAFIDRALPRCIWADCDLTFDFQMPKGSRIGVNGGSEAEFGRVSGSATIRGMVAILDSMQVVTNNEQKLLRFAASSDSTLPMLTTGSLPRKREFRVVGGNLSEPVRIERRVPESVFANVFEQTCDVDVAPKDCCNNVIAKIDKTQDGKPYGKTEMIPQLRLRTYPLLWR